MYPKTVDDLLKQIHVEYEGDTDFLDFEDEEVQLRVFHLKQGIREWIKRFPEYRETFTSLTDAANGDKTTTAGDNTCDCPTNFVRPANTIKVGSSYFTYISPQEVALKLQEDANSRWFTIIGRPGAYKIRLNPTPAGNEQIEYDYFKTVTIPTNTTSVVEISRPDFVAHYVLWKIFSEDDAEKAKQHFDAMDEEERLERVELAKTPGVPNTIKIQGAGFGDISSGLINITTGQ